MFKNSTFNIFLDTDLNHQHKKDYHSSEQIQNVQNNKNLQINETYDWLGLEENILYLTRIGITISISVVGIEVIQCCRN